MICLPKRIQLRSKIISTEDFKLIEGGSCRCIVFGYNVNTESPNLQHSHDTTKSKHCYSYYRGFTMAFIPCFKPSWKSIWSSVNFKERLLGAVLKNCVHSIRIVNKIFYRIYNLYQYAYHVHSALRLGKLKCGDVEHTNVCYGVTQKVYTTFITIRLKCM